MEDPYSFFYNIKNSEVFSFKGVNFLKIFYVRYWANTNQNQAQNYKKTNANRFSKITSWFFPFFKTLETLHKLSQLPTKNNKTFFIDDSLSRSIEIDNSNYSVYSHKIILEGGRENFILFSNNPTGKTLHYKPDIIGADLLPIKMILGLAIIFSWGIPTYFFIRRVETSNPDLQLNLFEAWKSVINFFVKYYFYYLLLHLLSPQRVFLICHYGHEALIEVCRKLNIPTIELMHGLILPDHKQYCYPAGWETLFYKCQFPDYIGVYGEYWKSILIHGHLFPEERVFILGYYLLMPPSKEPQKHNKKIVLIASQWTIHQEIFDYIRFLKQKLDPDKWEIWVKPHPNEKTEDLYTLEETGFVCIQEGLIYSLFQDVDYLISSYSTVIYESALYGLKTFSLYVERYDAICRHITNSGIALPLLQNEVPNWESQLSVNPTNLFAPFLPSNLNIFDKICSR